MTLEQAVSGKLPGSLKIGWATGAFGVAVLMNGVSLLILFYLVGIVKMEPALAGAVIFLAKVFDVVTDPLVGLWSDRLKHKYGRRRPFLLWGAFISAASFAMVFTVPSFESEWITAAYVLLALCLFAWGYTLFNIPYMAMPAEMTDDYHERSSIHTYRIVAVSLGGFVAGSIAPVAIERLGKSEASSYAAVSFACAGIILAAMLVAYFSTARARFSSSANAATNIWTEFSAIRSSPVFLRLIGVKFAQLIGMQTVAASMLFFIVQSLQLSLDVLVVFGLVSTAASIIAAPLLLAFSRRYGKREAYYVAAACNVAYYASWSFAGPGEPYWAIALRAAIVGVAMTGNVAMAMSMVTDIINFDAAKSGIRREGAYMAVYSFVEKITAALGPLIIGAALSIAGFNTKLPPDVPQGGNVDTALLFAVSWFPAAAGIVAIWLLTGYRLSEADLREAGSSAAPGDGSARA